MTYASEKPVSMGFPMDSTFSRGEDLGRSPMPVIGTLGPAVGRSCADSY